jgi:hypothetical protein
MYDESNILALWQFSRWMVSERGPLPFVITPMVWQIATPVPNRPRTVLFTVLSTVLFTVLFTVPIHGPSGTRLLKKGCDKIGERS